jgi:alpha-N-acetylglucosaminidase
MLLDATSSPSNSTPSISASTLASKQQYLHDVADIGVQCLSNLALQVHKRSVAAVMANNATAFHETAVEFLAILDDAELLAATQEGRLLGQWIDHARTSAVTPSFARQSSSEGDAADLYELNARTIVSLWGSADSNLHEYSYRLWGGMLSTFYKPRWASWFGKVEAAIRSHTRFNETKFYEDVEQWELAWTKQTGVDLPTKPAEGALEKARAVYARHFRVQ